MGRLIIISNRLPFSVEKTSEGIALRQSSGGLVSAIKSYIEGGSGHQNDYNEKIWVGSVEISEEEWTAMSESEKTPSGFELAPVFVEKDLYSDYYNGFSNSTLWPLFHYFPSLVEYKSEYFSAYHEVNRLFSRKVQAIYRPGDIVWVHDYQLMLLPFMVREKLPDATIGFFLHIPFPSYEMFRLLPGQWKKQLLNGILAADLIGFHTHDYVQHFIQSSKMVLEVENQFNTIYYKDRLIKTDLFPIGIDYNKFKNSCSDELTVNIVTKLEHTFEGQKIIFSVDRLDYTKGLNYRLEGFEKFLDEHPDWREKVVFILNIIPSRDLIPAYIERKKLIEEKVSTINGKHSTLHWQPIVYRYNHLEFEELCALYQVADVGLVTPLRDGMNLVAKEYIASCVDKGVLVLSELTGAASELNEALLVNPTDTSEVAQSIHKALTMPLVEQRSRLSYMKKRLKDYDVVRWVSDFMEQLMNAKAEQEKNKVNFLSDEALSGIIEKFRESSRRCILLDYDGTLSPIQKLPSMASPSVELLQLLVDLSRDESNDIIIISGRDADTLEKWLGHLPVNLVAEHGAMIRYKNGSWQQQGNTSPEWKDSIKPILQLFVTRCAGSFVEEKKNTLAWHYRNTQRDLGFIRSRELRNTLLQLTTNTPLQVIDGNKVLEVRIIGVDKGSTAQNMLNHLQPDFAICLGDDATDEDMFRSLRDKAITIKIGTGTTSAQFSLASQQHVLPLLRKFVSLARKEQYGYSQV